MADDDFWTTVQDKDDVSAPFRRTGVLNLSLLFGTAVIALTLIVTPMLASRKGPSVLADVPVALDDTITGSIPKSDVDKRYTVRRSVMQPIPGAVCIIDANGQSSGC